jgi:hypothetical protein
MHGGKDVPEMRAGRGLHFSWRRARQPHHGERSAAFWVLNCAAMRAYCIQNCAYAALGMALCKKFLMTFKKY